MNAIDNILKNSFMKKLEENKKYHDEQQSISEEAIELVNYLFKIFAIHIAAFNYFAKDDAQLQFAKQEWVHCFQKANLDEEQVIFGANKIRDEGSTYMLTPAQFIELCLDKQPIKPQSDTRDKEFDKKWALESDESKRRKREIALKNLSAIKKML